MREKTRAIIIASILSLIFILSAVWTAHQFLAKQEAASAAIYQNGTLIKIISTDHEEDVYKRQLYSTLGLQDLQQYPEGKALLRSIYKYLDLETFAPKQSIEWETLVSI